MTQTAEPRGDAGKAAAPRTAASRAARQQPHHQDEHPPASSTRERILDIALDLFVDQGYDGTSLREIAERLGVTKAALYYHFEAKEDILMALHMRLHDFGKSALTSMTGDEPITLERWGALLDEVVDQMLVQRKLFLMHERNQAALEKLHSEGHDAEHEDIQNQLRHVLSDPRLPIRDRVRMAASMGALFAGLFLPDDAFPDADNKLLGELLRDCLHDVLGR